MFGGKNHRSSVHSSKSSDFSRSHNWTLISKALNCSCTQKWSDNKTKTENSENSKIQSQFGKIFYWLLQQYNGLLEKISLDINLQIGKFYTYLFSITVHVRAFTKSFLVFYFLERADEFVKVHNNVTQNHFRNVKRFYKIYHVLVSIKVFYVN